MKKTGYEMKFLAVGVILAVLTGCASSERMLKISPFEEHSRLEMTGVPALNLWPLMYAFGDKCCVCWPLYDRDENGMAVRPFYSRNGAEHGVLSPLAGWNDQGGWVLNAYWRKDNYGCFPFFHQGSEFRFYGPVWFWGKQYGVFPLAALGGELKTVFPVVWSDRVLFFPGGYFSKRLNFLTSAWWNYNAAGTLDGYGVFPLFSRTEGLAAAGPVWWMENGSWGIFPCIWLGADYHTVLPFYFYRKMPGSIHFNLLGVLYHLRKTSQSTRQGVLVPFGRFQRWKNGNFEYGFWPFFEWSNHRDRMPQSLFTKGGNGQLAILGPFGYSRSGIRHFSGDGGLPNTDRTPLGHDALQEPNRLLDEVTTVTMFPLYVRKQTRFRVWKPGVPTEAFSALAEEFRTLEWSDILISGSSGKNENAELNRIRLEKARIRIAARLAELGEKDWPAPNTLNALRTLRRRLVEKYCADKTGVSHLWGMTLLADFTGYGTDYRNTVMYFVYRDTKVGNCRERQVLYRVFRQLENGKEKYVEFFPFVSWARTEKERVFSVAWKLFRREEKAGKIQYWLFFLTL